MLRVPTSFPDELERLIHNTIGCGIQVHRLLGPGLHINPVHHAQVMSYLRVSGLKVALLMNFNVAVLPDGLKRIVLT
jgi:hypothetical protein